MTENVKLTALALNCITAIFSCAAGPWATLRPSLQLPELALKVHSESKNFHVLSLIPIHLTVIGLSLAQDKKIRLTYPVLVVILENISFTVRKVSTHCSQILLGAPNRSVRAALCRKMVVAQGDVPSILELGV